MILILFLRKNPYVSHGFTPLGVRTIGPKTFHLASKSNYSCIASFQFGQSFLCRQSSMIISS